MVLTDTIMVAGITAAATVITQVIIAFRVNSLITYRIGQLEKKVEKHNKVIERTHDLELALTAVSERSKSNSHRIDKLERGNG